MGEDCPHCVFEKTEANCPGCFEGSHYRPKPITNYDLLRTKSVEEMAEFLLNRDLNVVEKASKVVGFTYKVDREQCLTNVIDWLKQEVSTNG